MITEMLKQLKAYFLDLSGVCVIIIGQSKASLLEGCIVLTLT